MKKKWGETMRIIDYEEIRKLFDEEYKRIKQLIEEGETHLDNLAEGFVGADGVIWKLPDVDVAEVKHGEWIHTDMAEYWHSKDKCSNCTYHTFDRTDLSHFNYCPYCGAKMDGAKND